jgi:hypothetical protein
MQTLSSIRTGNITSSEGAVAIMSNGKAKGTLGKPALTYIEECNFERRLGRSIDTESNARPLTWGRLVEGRVFELLGLEYQLVSSETIQHPSINYWVGSPDAIKEDEGRTVIDIKSPITLKSFCQLVAPLYEDLYDGSLDHGLICINALRAEHRDGEKYYWQLVSNAILTNSKYAELIVYVPFKSELEAIREIIQTGDGEMQSKYGWINWANDDELPWIPDGGYYKNINVIRFEIPEEDKEALTERMKMCGELLI